MKVGDKFTNEFYTLTVTNVCDDGSVVCDVQDDSIISGLIPGYGICIEVKQPDGTIDRPILGLSEVDRIARTIVASNAEMRRTVYFSDVVQILDRQARVVWKRP